MLDTLRRFEIDNHMNGIGFAAGFAVLFLHLLFYFSTPVMLHDEGMNRFMFHAESRNS